MKKETNLSEEKDKKILETLIGMGWTGAGPYDAELAGKHYTMNICVLPVPDRASAYILREAENWEHHLSLIAKHLYRELARRLEEYLLKKQTTCTEGSDSTNFFWSTQEFDAKRDGAFLKEVLLEHDKLHDFFLSFDPKEEHAAKMRELEENKTQSIEDAQAQIAKAKEEYDEEKGSLFKTLLEENREKLPSYLTAENLLNTSTE